ncbi:hypothetical protein SQW19_16490 [Stenotrophomonas acidaminiphila]|uniref:hypothetical protein n=1 Tax=Stenotrophomonas acidaminiphila TaxID=128780 RepID=UPI002ABD42A9|nr:hypothetical protein [Stenotrophomonas acidaminiphila]WPU55904.1 hypothetical protein SQW19_16490 [Stenotrophomonas acidaminiphila]
MTVVVSGPLLALAGSAWLSYQAGAFAPSLSSGELWAIGLVPCLLVLLFSIAAAAGAFLLIDRDHDSWLEQP